MTLDEAKVLIELGILDDSVVYSYNHDQATFFYVTSEELLIVRGVRARFDRFLNARGIINTFHGSLSIKGLDKL